MLTHSRKNREVGNAGGIEGQVLVATHLAAAYSVKSFCIGRMKSCAAVYGCSTRAGRSTSVGFRNLSHSGCFQALEFSLFLFRFPYLLPFNLCGGVGLSQPMRYRGIDLVGTFNRVELASLTLISRGFVTDRPSTLFVAVDSCSISCRI